MLLSFLAEDLLRFGLIGVIPFSKCHETMTSAHKGTLTRLVIFKKKRTITLDVSCIDQNMTAHALVERALKTATTRHTRENPLWPFTVWRSGISIAALWCALGSFKETTTD